MQKQWRIFYTVRRLHIMTSRAYAGEVHCVRRTETQSGRSFLYLLIAEHILMLGQKYNKCRALLQRSATRSSRQAESGRRKNYFCSHFPLK